MKIKEVMTITKDKDEEKSEDEPAKKDKIEKIEEKKEVKLEQSWDSDGPKIIEVKKIYWDIDRKMDFELNSLDEMMELAKLLKVEAVYKYGKRYFFKDSRWVWYYVKT